MKTAVKLYLWCSIGKFLFTLILSEHYVYSLVYYLCTVSLFCGEIVQVTSDENSVGEYKLIPPVFIPHANRGQGQTTRKWVPQCEFVPEEFDLSIFNY